VVTSIDPRADVRLTPRKHLTRTQKLSIDLRRVTVQRVDRSARIILEIRNVLRAKKFDQMFFVDWSEHPDTLGGAWAGQVGFTSKGRYSYSYYSNADSSSYENCGAQIAVRPKREEVVATVPWRCVPVGPLRIRVRAITGHFRTDGPAYSRDLHAIAGYHVIR